MEESKALKAQREGRFEDMETRDKEIQAAIWGLIFLISEISLAFRSLRDRLTERGALLPEDEELINTLSSDEGRMKLAYEHIERAFREKFARVQEAMENPEVVAQAVANRDGGTTIDLNDPNVPMVSGTESEFQVDGECKHA